MPLPCDSLGDLEKAKLRALFDKVDTNKDGQISSTEIQAVAKVAGFELSEGKAKKILAKADADNSGAVSWDEFVAALLTLGVKIRLRFFLCALFKETDTDGDGKISPDEIKAVVAKAGVTDYISDAHIQDFVKEADKDGDGKVSFKEFVASMKKMVKE